MTPTLILSFLFYLYHLILLSNAASAAADGGEIAGAATSGGKWDLLLSNVGISAMHMQLLYNDKVVMYDRTDFGKSKISLPNGKCRNETHEKALKKDCTAHSVEYDVVTNTIRPLMVLTDLWCSSGGVTPNGTLIQTGGYNNGSHVVRFFQPCSDGKCDWKEIKGGLISPRWYSTNHVLPDGRQIIIGGRREFNFEFFPKDALHDKIFGLKFLLETYDSGIENNLYPFVFLNPDGNLFIFANTRSILFDYKKKVVVKTFPEIPGGEPRNYPSTGSAVLLPLKNSLDNDTTMAVEVLICGGAPRGSFVKAKNGTFLEALNSCGKMNINDPNPKWTMENMPIPRVMGDMVLLPNGHVLIINGARSGTAGWEYAQNPVLNPVLYRPDNPDGSRFEVQNPSEIPRMYHSSVVLLHDGRVLVGGSNPHKLYRFDGVNFPTELRLEAFSPWYLDPHIVDLRPQIMLPSSQIKLPYDIRTKIRFFVRGVLDPNSVKVTMMAPSFNTHSFSMNQRLLVLTSDNVTLAGKYAYEIKVRTPSSSNLAPLGYYLLFVVHRDIPSKGIWVQLQ